jgi:hypothetical protein
MSSCIDKIVDNSVSGSVRLAGAGVCFGCSRERQNNLRKGWYMESSKWLLIRPVNAGGVAGVPEAGAEWYAVHAYNDVWAYRRIWSLVKRGVEIGADRRIGVGQIGAMVK